MTNLPNPRKLHIKHPIPHDRAFLVISNDYSYSSKKVAAFDMDWTLIKASKGIFVQTPDNLLLWDKCVPKKLLELHEDGYKISVFTNQSGIEKNKITEKKLLKLYQTFFDKLKIPKIQIFVAAKKDQFRKPSIAMWLQMVQNFNSGIDICKAESFYVGDAAGRVKNVAIKRKRDFSVADRKFAHNIGIKFFTPEKFFLGESSPEKWNWRSFDPHLLRDKIRTEIPLFKEDVDFDEIKNECKLFVLCGPQGVGKSTFAKKHLCDFKVVSTEQFRTHKRCVKELKYLLESGETLIAIDNTNPTEAKRLDFIKEALKKNLAYKILFFDETKEFSKHMCTCREIIAGSKAKKVGDVARNVFFKHLEVPKGDHVLTVNFVPEFSNDSERIFLNWT